MSRRELLDHLSINPHVAVVFLCGVATGLTFGGEGQWALVVLGATWVFWIAHWIADRG